MPIFIEEVIFIKILMLTNVASSYSDLESTTTV